MNTNPKCRKASKKLIPRHNSSADVAPGIVLSRKVDKHLFSERMACMLPGLNLLDLRQQAKWGFLERGNEIGKLRHVPRTKFPARLIVHLDASNTFSSV
jgi:hypothetical protein